MSTESLAQPKTVPGPRGHPVVGSLFSLLKDPLGFAQETQRLYGDLVAFNVGQVQLYFVSSPDYIKHILQDNHHNYGKGTMWKTLRRVFSNGLFASEGSFWLRQRRLMQPAFHRQRLAGLTALMTDTIAQTVERWDQYAQTGTAFNLSREMTEITLRILLNTLFSRGLSDDEVHILDDGFSQALKLVNRRLWLFALPERLPLPGDRRFRQVVEGIDNIVYRVVDERRQMTDRPNDLLTMLLETQDADTGETMTDSQVRDEVFSFFLAGHETTATTMRWLWHSLHQHPHVTDKLYKEIDDVLAGRTPTFTDLPSLKYTLMVIEENMRLYPPAWIIPRSVEEVDFLDGYRLKRGSTVLVCPYTLQRNPQYWENPDQFEPERFGADRSVNRFAYMPFGAGPRVCIGNSFALMEKQLMIAMILQKFRLNITNATEVKASALPTLQPDRNLIATVERRP